MRPGIGRALDPREPDSLKLSTEWKALRGLITLVLDGATKPKPAPAAGGASADGTLTLIDLLRRSPVEPQSGDIAVTDRLQCLKGFLIDAPSAGRVDNRYWLFDVYDGFGGKRDCRFRDTIDGLLRVTSPRRGVAVFLKSCATARTPDDVARCVKMLHDDVLCHVKAIRCGDCTNPRSETRRCVISPSPRGRWNWWQPASACRHAVFTGASRSCSPRWLASARRHHRKMRTGTRARQ